MWDRIAEVFAIYGAICAILVLSSRYGMADQTLEKRMEMLYGMIFGWSLMTAVPGVLYVLLGALF